MSLVDVLVGGAIASGASVVLFVGEHVLSRRTSTARPLVDLEGLSRAILIHADALIDHRRRLELGSIEKKAVETTAAEANSAINAAYQARTELLWLNTGVGLRGHRLLRALDAAYVHARDGDVNDVKKLKKLRDDVHRARARLLVGWRFWRRGSVHRAMRDDTVK